MGKGRSYTIDEIKDIAEALGYERRLKNDPASTTLDAPGLHGPLQGNASQYGAFSSPGVRPEMFTTLVRPPSLLNILGNPVRSEYVNELLEIMTGQTAASGTNATGVCGNPPTVGQLKTCKQKYIFGEMFIKTNLEAAPKVGELRNRADIPRIIMNRPRQYNPWIPELFYDLADTRDNLAIELYRLGVEVERGMEFVGVQGLTSRNSTQTRLGWISEFDGLDRQIREGYVDEDTNLACPAVDSDVHTWNADIAATVGGNTISQELSDIFYGRRNLADKLGLNPNWAWFGREEMFRPLTERIACDYASYRCTGTAGNPNVTQAADSNALRLEMMNGQYLLIDNIQVPYVFSEGVPRTAIGNNHFFSDLSLLPYGGDGMPYLYPEYFPMDNPYAQRMANFVAQDKVVTMNNGLYMMGYRDTGLCIEYLLYARLRLILGAPFLAARLDNVQYQFRGSIRTSDPSDTFYNKDGGATYRL